jgi:hypothetical protein
MGTRAVSAGDVFDRACDLDEIRQRKLELFASARREVVVDSCGTRAAVDGAARFVEGAVGGRLDPAWPALQAAALLVPEDLVVLVRRRGSWVLGAGVVCFPSHWSLPDKLGQTMTALHAPVPGYRDELAPRVDRFLDRLHPGRPVGRRNWTIHASGELHAPRPVVTDALAPGEHWLRSEQQRLVALSPRVGILFTIRTQQVRLDTLHGQAAPAARLAAALRATPPELREYRFNRLDLESIAWWLEQIGRADSEASGRPGSS